LCLFPAPMKRIFLLNLTGSHITLLSCFLMILELPVSFAQELQPVEQNGWRKLFNGQSLENWRATNFGGEGNVEVEDGQIILEMGSDLTGITWTGEFPTVNYEVSLEARRMEGNDFFCGMTFPVGKSPCSLIVGGWGGTVVGLSSIDGRDASENETGKLMTFDRGRWYSVRLRVCEPKIEAWIDEKKVIDLDAAHRKISIRPEVELSRPFGIATWRTKAGIRAIKVRSIEGK
jgi:3-keto-disaccharide hydrolase